jgi:Protein of unknown function (DUF732)
MWGRGGRSGRHAAPTGSARRASGTVDRAAGAAADPVDLDEPHRSDGARPRPGRGGARRARPGPAAVDAAPISAADAGATDRADATAGPADVPPVAGPALFEPGTAGRVESDGGAVVHDGGEAGHLEPMAIIGGSAITLLAGRIRRRHTIADLESPTAELRATLPGPGTPPGAEARRRAEPPRHARAARPATTAEADPPPAPPDAGATPKRADRRGRRPSRGQRVPVTALVVGTLAVAGVIIGLVVGTRSEPVTAAAPAPPTVLEQPARLPTGAPSVADPAAAYLGALRSAAIPASRSGRPETEAAAAICEQSRRGVPDAELARALPAMLARVDRRQAPIVVELAKQHYCP